jgi:hypothetical protein
MQVQTEQLASVSENQEPGFPCPEAIIGLHPVLDQIALIGISPRIRTRPARPRRSALVTRRS